MANNDDLRLNNTSELASEKYNVSLEDELECKYAVIAHKTIIPTIEDKQECKYAVIAHKPIIPTVSQHVQPSSRCKTNHKRLFLGVTVGIVITIFSVTCLTELIPKPNLLQSQQIITESTTSSGNNYSVQNAETKEVTSTRSVNTVLKIYSQSDIPSSNFIGITAITKPTKLPIISSFMEVALDISNVVINSGVDTDIVHTIKCPVDGVYFLSVSAMHYGKDLNFKWISLHLKQNLKKLIRLEMGSYIKRDIATDDHAFIYCAKGDLVALKYTKLGVPSIGADAPMARITLMFIAPSDEKITGFYARQFNYQNICNNKPERTFDTTMFNPTLFKVNKFVCPVKGIYLVTASYTTDQDQATIIIVNNRQPIMSMVFTEGLHKGWFTENLISSASNSILTNCLANDKLHVKTGYDPKRCKSAYKSKMMFGAILLHRDGDDTFVGVSAWKKTNQEYRFNDTITFDSTLLNEGGYFNTHTSRFVCPHNGFYYTALTVRKMEVNPLQLSLQLEYKSVFQIEHLHNTQPNNMMSSSSLLHCKEGEEIYVIGTGDGVVYGSAKHVITTITIILMHDT